MRRIDSEIASEGASQYPVGPDQRPKALVDLPVHAFPPLLDRDHTRSRIPTAIRVTSAIPPMVRKIPCHELISMHRNAASVRARAENHSDYVKQRIESPRVPTDLGPSFTKSRSSIADRDTFRSPS
jgi:hypothetical protein